MISRKTALFLLTVFFSVHFFSSCDMPVDLKDHTRPVLPLELPQFHQNPAWHPNGKEITFEKTGYVVFDYSDLASTKSVFTADSIGTYIINLENGPDRKIMPFRVETDWNSDGTKLVCSTSKIIFTVDYYDNKVHPSSVKYLVNYWPSFGAQWSPDDQWIAFCSMIFGLNSSYLIRPDSSELHSLVTDNNLSYNPVWAGRSDRLILSFPISEENCLKAECRINQLKLIDTSRNELRELYRGDVNSYYNHDVSSDGKMIVIEKVTGELILLDVDTGRQTVLTNHGRQPAFSPDGTQIAYINSRNALSLMNSDGTNARTIVPGPKRYQPPREDDFK